MFDDRLIRFGIAVVLLLEVVVFAEPAPVDALIVLLFCGALLLGKLNFHQIRPFSLMTLTGFAAANLLSLFHAYDSERALLYLLVTFYLILSWLLFVGLLGHYGSAMAETMVRVYCIAGFISACLGILGYFHLVPFSDLLLLNGRARGLFKDCNVYGPYFVPMALIGFNGLTGSAESWLGRARALVLFSASCLALLLCFSRAAWINCGVALLIYLVGQLIFLSSPRQRRIRLFTSGALLAAGAGILVLVLAVPSVSDMLTQRVTASGLKDYDRVRFRTQELALEQAIERPLGIGPGQVETEFIVSTHSMYLRVLSENGVFAVLMFLAFIGATAYRALKVCRLAVDPKSRELSLIVFACIVGHLINSFVVDTVHWRHIWFLYALPWAPYRLRSTMPSAFRRKLPIRPLSVHAYGA